MTDHNQADEARKGLIDSVKGKAKEVVGAVTGNDSLTREGQLDQAQAQERKEANKQEALADAEADQARAQVTEAKREGAEERIAVNVETAAEKDAIAEQQAAQKRATTQAAHQDLAKERIEAELDASHKVQQADTEQRIEERVATNEVKDALDYSYDAVRESVDARAEAARLRQAADGLAADAEVPKNQ